MAPPRVRSDKPVSGLTHGQEPSGRIATNTVVEGALDTFVPQDPKEMEERMKLSATEPIAGRQWTLEGLNPLQERMIKMILAATDVAMSHLDAPPADQGGPDKARKS